MKKNVLFLLLLTVQLSALTQDRPVNDTTALAPKKSYGLAGLEYTSNSTFFGRADSLKTPYLTPSIGYYDKSGFYIGGYLSVLLRAGEMRVDMSALSAGYTIEKGTFYGELNAEKYFYHGSSTNVAAEVKGAASISMSYDLNFIEPFVIGGLSFQTKSDVWLSLGAEKGMEFGKKKWTLTPSVMLNGSTRNFHGAYFANRRFRRKGPGTTISASVPDASRFKFMDAELAIPLEYKRNRLRLSITPTYAVPFNPAKLNLVINPSIGPTFTRTYTEQIRNQFFVAMGVDYKF